MTPPDTHSNNLAAVWRISVAAAMSYASFGLAAWLPFPEMWGMNHLRFLPSWAVWLYLTLGVLLLLSFTPLAKDHTIRRIVEQLDARLLSKRPISRIVAVVVLTALFFLLRIDTYLLGDGYTWLAVFGRGNSYIHKWAEPGSIWLLRTVQAALGGYTESTARQAFQLLSIVSGAVFFYNVFGIIKRLITRAETRLLAFIVLLFSGSTLLFMGYVEFYPLVWAATAVFFNCSLAAMQDRKSIWWALLAIAAAILMHVQAVVFLPACAYLIYSRLSSERAKKIAIAVGAIGLIGAIVAFFWLHHTRIWFEILILPFFQGRPEAPDYTVFSLIHLRDLINLAALMIPGLLILLATIDWRSIRSGWRRVDTFLAFASVGGLIFLMTFGAAITMGRDWDVMSLSLLAPLLLLLSLLDRSKNAHPRILPAITVVSLLATGSFIAVAMDTTATERRFETLLNSRNQNGWIILGQYYQAKGESDRHLRIKDEITRRFPDYSLLQSGYDLLERGRVDAAASIADKLISRNPYDPNFMQFQANVFRAQGKYADAEKYYRQALSLKPYQVTILNELAQLYMTTKEYDKAIETARRARSLDREKTYIAETLALAYIYTQNYRAASTLADSLFTDHPDFPGAHLIKMTAAVNLGDLETARHHYRAFLRTGQNRSDYTDISEYYRYLLDTTRQQN